MRVLLAIFFLTGTALFGDGGTVVARTSKNDLAVTVFASPSPLRAGRADFSVLVQDVRTREPISGARVSVLLDDGGENPRDKDWAVLCNELNGLGTRADASTEHSVNRWLYSAFVGIPAPGRWELRVDVETPAGARAEVVQILEIQPPAPPLLAWWPFLAIVPVGIMLYAWRRKLLGLRRLTNAL